jgi:hypothetical protein
MLKKLMIKAKEIVDEVVKSLLEEYPDKKVSDFDDFWKEAWDRIVDQLAYNGISINAKPPVFPPFLKKEKGAGMMEKIKKHLLEHIEPQLKPRHPK